MPDTNESAGATPAAAGATPAQTSPAQPAADPSTAAPETPATGDPEALGDAGKRALDVMKAERNAALTAQKAAERERDELKLATASDTDKAIAAAKKAGADEVLSRVHAQVRRSEIKAALSAAGISASVLDLAAKADEFAALKVDDEGEVEGLAEAVKQFKKDRADLFSKPAGAAGSADGGAGGTGRPAAKSLDEAIAGHYADS